MDLWLLRSLGIPAMYFMQILPLTLGVSLSLNGVTISNNSNVPFRYIGSDGILCNTDRSDCCRSADHPHRLVQGHWYYPEGNEVPNEGTQYQANPNGNFFARNRDTGVVRLFPTGIPTERGHFRCEIPNASGVNEVLYVNIIVDGEYMIVYILFHLPNTLFALFLCTGHTAKAHLVHPHLSYNSFRHY